MFDVDGTLYRLRPLRRAVQIHFVRGNWHRPGAAMRVLRAVSAYRQAIDDLREVPVDGRDLKDKQIDLAARKASLPEEFVQECVRRWMEEEPLAFLIKFRFEGIVELLAEFRERGARLGVFSDFPAEEKLKALELEEFFEVALSAHDKGVQRFKPDPRGLRAVLEQLRVEPEEAVYVGDRPSIDGLAAERAGMSFLLAGDGHRDPRGSVPALRKILLPEVGGS